MEHAVDMAVPRSTTLCFGVSNMFQLDKLPKNILYGLYSISMYNLSHAH